MKASVYILGALQPLTDIHVTGLITKMHELEQVTCPLKIFVTNNTSQMFSGAETVQKVVFRIYTFIDHQS